MNKIHEPNPYLWNPAEPPDPEILRLEQLLKVYRIEPGRPPEFSRVAPRRQSRWMVIHSSRSRVEALATIAILIFAAVLLTIRQRAVSWEVSAQGDVKVDGVPTAVTKLRPGQWLVTGRGSEAKLHLSNLGTMSLGDNTAITVIEDSGHKRLLMRYGSVHARIVADPGVFVLETPFARATDLGCEFDLHLEPNGAGTLRVFAGWVGLEYMESQSLVPQGAEALIAGPGAITPAYFVDASDDFKKALRTYSVASANSAERANALSVLVRNARLRDSYTLINLFRISDSSERVAVFDRLNGLIPAPDIVAREDVIDGDLKPLNAWWPVVLEKLGLTAIKKNTALNLSRYRGGNMR